MTSGPMPEASPMVIPMVGKEASFTESNYAFSKR
jgi:hypothetical protein